MRKILILTTLAAFFSCSSDDGSTATTATATTAATLTNVPNSLAQPMSKSLNGSGNAMAAMATGGPAANVTSQIYTYVKQSAGFAKTLMKDISIAFVALDEQLAAPTSGQCVSSYTINVTPELKAKMIEMMTEMGGIDSETESAINNLGASVSSAEIGAPAFTYTSINEGGFKHELKLAMDAQDQATCAANPPNSQTIRYNDDKSKTQLVDTQTLPDGAGSIKIQISNDDSAKKTTMIFSGSFGTFKMKDRLTFKTCSSTQSSSTNGTCNIVDFESTLKDTSAGFEGKIKGSGKADDSGGQAIARASFTGGAPAYYKEQWTGDGNATYLGTSANENGPFTTVAGTEASNDQYNETSYDVGDSWTFSDLSSLADGGYAIVISGKDPDTDGDEVIVGAGFKDATAGINLEWEFWGAQAGTYDVFLYDIDNGNFGTDAGDLTVTAASN